MKLQNRKERTETMSDHVYRIPASMLWLLRGGGMMIFESRDHVNATIRVGDCDPYISYARLIRDDRVCDRLSDEARHTLRLNGYVYDRQQRAYTPGHC